MRHRHLTAVLAAGPVLFRAVCVAVLCSFVAAFVFDASELICTIASLVGFVWTWGSMTLVDVDDGRNEQS